MKPLFNCLTNEHIVSQSHSIITFDYLNDAHVLLHVLIFLCMGCFVSTTLFTDCKDISEKNNYLYVLVC